ncbi:MAG: hypothetical protein EOM22_12455 [Gammaproteobacteria bacterium]|nr:hypothetical protein [Gammaproteobacteria bacterium]
MNTETKQLRPAISAEIIRALELAVRPLTLTDLFELCESAETKNDLARVLSYLKSEGKIKNGPEVQPNEPGGLSGKGARAVASYVIATDSPEPAIRQGKTGDIVAVMRGQADGFDRLDDAADSRGGDEFEWTPEVSDMRRMADEDLAFEHDLRTTRQIADESLIDIANALLGAHPAWLAAKRMHRAMTDFLGDYA